MSTLAPETTILATDDGDSLTHAVCCIDDIAICGADVTGQEWATDDEELTCVVCIDLVEQPCPRCGL